MPPAGSHYNKGVKAKMPVCVLLLLLGTAKTLTLNLLAPTTVGARINP